MASVESCKVGREAREHIDEQPEHVRELYRDWTYTRMCVRCNTPYTELDNIGRAQCRVHLGTYNNREDGCTQPRFHYECCGASQSLGDVHYETDVPRGCFPTDHTVIAQPYEKAGSKMGDEWLEIVAVPLRFERYMSGGRLPATNVLATITSNDEERRTKVRYVTHDGDVHEFTPRELWPSGPLFATAADFFGADAEVEDWYVASYYDHAVSSMAEADGGDGSDNFEAYHVVRRTSRRRDERRVAFYKARGSHRTDVRSFGISGGPRGAPKEPTIGPHTCPTFELYDIWLG